MLVIQRTLDSPFHLLVSNDLTSHKLGVNPLFSGTPISLIKLFAYHQRILIVSPFHPPSIPIPSISPFCSYSWFKSVIYIYMYIECYIYIYAHAEYFPIFGQFNHIRPSIFPVVETFQPVTKIEDMVVTHFEITNEIVPSYSCPFHSQDSIYIYMYYHVSQIQICYCL